MVPRMEAGLEVTGRGTNERKRTGAKGKEEWGGGKESKASDREDRYRSRHLMVTGNSRRWEPVLCTGLRVLEFVDGAWKADLGLESMGRG
ncbi:hypothetical protein AXG93_4620s2230 [Marchantia polymorpha subsp. ruderalis]|uniref:Uncharacterized protein n=1 Tax=Marchantia polymorpha subsp. ruderalis TaxID=1480154 RepID=A0A176VX64_MARPO|nr:hypothetical protein AXG93_4620s2230 [Marchantia polymorpha subsp. ruderalis]